LRRDAEASIASLSWAPEMAVNISADRRVLVIAR
jgi:hypothetical protein